MKRARDIMNIKPNPKDKNFGRVLTAQQSVIASVLSTVARVNGGSLRGGQSDEVGEILELLKSKPAGEA